MIYESQVRRSQAHPAGQNGAEHEQPGPLSATLQPIEDALQRGVDFAKANPLVAAAGAAAVGALVVLAARKTSSPRRDELSIDRMRYDLERFLDRHRNDASGIGQALSSAFTRVMDSEPETVAMLKKAGERVMTRAADTLKATIR